jgi:uncharacterized coiled-coil protein SlyX
MTHECKCSNNDQVIQDLARKIVNQEMQIESLQEDKEKLQGEYNQIKSKEYQTSYTIENQKKRIEDLGKALTLYETENKALRGLLQLWV